MEKLRIIFMGTPDFAVGILDALHQSNCDIAAVITAPDKPSGRGQKVTRSAVKEYAVEKGLPVLQPVNLKSQDFIEELKAFKANLQIVVAFRMLPKVVWEMPKYGTFNLHASLLPEYRGAAPINWAIINGETKTGVSTFFIDEKIDTGAVIVKKEMNIETNDTAGSLHDKLMNLGKEAVIDTLKRIESNNVNLILQPQENEKMAYKLTKENCRINWSKSGVEIHNLIRGLCPYPAAWTIFTDGLNEWNVKIYESSYEKMEHTKEIGSVMCTKKSFQVFVNDGILELKNLQFPARKRMNASEILNGMNFSTELKVV